MARDNTLRTIAQAMDRLGCSRAKIYSLARQGRLILVKFDSRTRVTERSLQKLEASLQKQRVELSGSDNGTAA